MVSPLYTYTMRFKAMHTHHIRRTTKGFNVTPNRVIYAKTVLICDPYGKSKSLGFRPTQGIYIYIYIVLNAENHRLDAVTFTRLLASRRQGFVEMCVINIGNVHTRKMCASGPVFYCCCDCISNSWLRTEAVIQIRGGFNMARNLVVLKSLRRWLRVCFYWIRLTG